jgi:hypothetical protein
VADVGHGTYLTVDWPRDVKPDNVEGYGHKGGYPRKGINLTTGIIQSEGKETPKEEPITTDPYCPTVGTTPSDDTPLIAQSSEELPTEKRKVEHHGYIQWKAGNTQEDAINDMPELHHRPC